MQIVGAVRAATSFTRMVDIEVHDVDARLGSYEATLAALETDALAQQRALMAVRRRLACAITGRSPQQIITESLDNFLNDLPEIDRLTQQLPHMRGNQ